jgi:hypothetical protein
MIRPPGLIVEIMLQKGGTMRLDEARSFMMQALRDTGWNQAPGLMASVGLVKARSQGINPNLNRSYRGGAEYLEPGDETLLIEVIWNLIVQGILVPGLNDSNQGYPFLRLTEYGKRCVAEDRLLPHDPDGYLREFHKAIPAADPIIVEYLIESIQCYVRGLNRAAAVMLGAASEQSILVLIGGYAASISDGVLKERFESEIERATSIFRKYESFSRRLTGVIGHLPKDLADNLDTRLRGVFDLIRSSRNEAGHPASGIEIDRDAIYAHLRLFIPYCKKIYGLIEWFSINKT